ncbi:hypothetical protein ACVIJU_002656 [Aeribacillus sp. SP014]
MTTLKKLDSRFLQQSLSWSVQEWDLPSWKILWMK